ncbi:MAG TPA: hypothetical protein VE891_13060 [Allosphingosinicella sp.]|nr:hypothetical protein [Allosphingosinicella sp.]
MGVYLVTWKLNPERANHDEALAGFIERLEAYQYIHDEDFETVYFISSPLTAGQINVDLHSGLEPDDKVIIAPLTAHAYCGWLPQVMWDWIEERL